MAPGQGFPVIKYVYLTDLEGELHMLPAIEDVVMKGHLMTEECFCGPKRVQGTRNGKPMKVCVHFIVN
jgi:hypothetical protein